MSRGKMAVIIATRLSLEICEALGLDPMDVTDIDISLGVGRVATVNITRFIKSSEVDNLAKVLERYEITKVKV